jgi:hypothetical protein
VSSDADTVGLATIFPRRAWGCYLPHSCRQCDYTERTLRCASADCDGTVALWSQCSAPSTRTIPEVPQGTSTYCSVFVKYSGMIVSLFAPLSVAPDRTGHSIPALRFTYNLKVDTNTSPLPLCVDAWRAELLLTCVWPGRTVSTDNNECRRSHRVRRQPARSRMGRARV